MTMRVKPVIISSAAGMKVSAVSVSSVWIDSVYVWLPPAPGVLVSAGNPPACAQAANGASKSRATSAIRRRLVFFIFYARRSV